MTKVLVVDDDDALRESLCDILEGAGLDAFGAADGGSALAVIRAGGVDAMVLDMHMPGLSGLGVLAELEGGRPNVVVYSAFEYVDQRALTSAFGDRVCAVLRKPTSPRELVHRVVECAGAGT
jgi:DNA-binding response OmpR family regulator